MAGRRAVLALAATVLGLAAAAPAAAAGEALTRLAAGGRVLLLRHALAPGVGDPPGFRLDDCTTQRNLDETGRAQARRLGARLAAAGITAPRILTSRWCRARETAELIGLGRVEPFPPLDSFFADAPARALSVAALGRFLAELPTDGPPVVMVTHQVNITALTGIVPASGEALLLRLDGSERPPVEARITPDP